MRLESADRLFSYYWFHSAVALLIFSTISMIYMCLPVCHSQCVLVTSSALIPVFFLLGDGDRRLEKTSDDTGYWVVLLTAVCPGLLVGMCLYRATSRNRTDCLVILPFVSAAISASAFYTGREAYEDTDSYDYKGSFVPLAVVIFVLLIVCITRCNTIEDSITEVDLWAKSPALGGTQRKDRVRCTLLECHTDHFSM